MNNTTNPEITRLFTEWRKGELEGLNKRQEAILKCYQAFLSEHPGDFDDMVTDIPDAMNYLWRMSYRSGNQPSAATQGEKEAK